MGTRKITISWSDRAVEDLNRIHSFNIELKGKAKADRLVVGLKAIIHNRLGKSIDGSQPDFQFSHLSKGIRKILWGYHKVSFLSRGDLKIVLRIFDTRQHPNKNL